LEKAEKEDTEKTIIVDGEDTPTGYSSESMSEGTAYMNGRLSNGELYSLDLEERDII